MERGYTPPPSYHIDRLRKVAGRPFLRRDHQRLRLDARLQQQIPPRDRWAIAAYIRALQLSQHFPGRNCRPTCAQEWTARARPRPRGAAHEQLPRRPDRANAGRAGSGGAWSSASSPWSSASSAALFSPAQFFRAYLAAYLFYLGIGLGSLVILMIYHLTGGAWGFLIRRILEAGMRTLPLLACSSSRSPAA